jgi:hypothetical protein
LSNNGTTINTDFGRMWDIKEMAQFEILTRHYPGKTKENHGKPWRTSVKTAGIRT